MWNMATRLLHRLKGRRVGKGHGRGQQGGGGQTITGSLTLAEAAALTGRTAQRAQAAPVASAGHVPDSTRLRQIADAQGWSMPELREKFSR